MNKALSFVRLDYLTVKPYLTWKNLLIFTGVAFILIISSGSGVSGVAILMAYAALYISYPFAVGEKNGIDALYTTLAIKRSAVVKGRYLFTLLVDLSAGLLAYAFAFIITALLQKEFAAGEILLVTLVLFLLFSVIQAVQLPIYFRFGYAKAKLMAYLPFVGVPLVVVAVMNLFHVSLEQITEFMEWMMANPFLTVLLVAFIWIGIFGISYRISLGSYHKRDF